MAGAPYRMSASASAPVPETERAPMRPSVRDEDDAGVTLVEGEGAPWAPLPRWRRGLLMGMQSLVTMAVAVPVYMAAGTLEGLGCAVFAGALFAWQYRAITRAPDPRER